MDATAKLTTKQRIKAAQTTARQQGWKQCLATCISRGNFNACSIFWIWHTNSRTTQLTRMKIEGRNSILEALRSGTTLNTLLCEKGKNDEIVALARQQGTKIQFVDKAVLNKASISGKHQGFIAEVTDFVYCDVEELIAQNSNHFLVVLDGLNDPHNFGSIIRVCECAGVDGIIIGKNRQVAVNDTVVRCSAGAISHVKIARVTNLNNAIKQLQQAGIWVYACDMDGQPITQTNLTGSIALVVGGEGSGVGKLTKQLCDGVVSLPLKGKVNSLNASVACGIAVYEALRQRG